MKQLLKRYGGSSIIIGQGKASNSNLPEDQSLDNMLDNYAKEIIPNNFYISSYDAMPKWMGPFKNEMGSKLVKLGTLEHDLEGCLFQSNIEIISDIYITNHHYQNVYSVFIKTHKEEMEIVMEKYEVTYDYVLLVWIKPKDENDSSLLKDNPKKIERILTILFYKMDLIYEDSTLKFTPSKTYLGKRISKEFINTIKSKLVDVENDEDLKSLL